MLMLNSCRTTVSWTVQRPVAIWLSRDHLLKRNVNFYTVRFCSFGCPSNVTDAPSRGVFKHLNEARKNTKFLKKKTQRTTSEFK